MGNFDASAKLVKKDHFVVKYVITEFKCRHHLPCFCTSILALSIPFDLPKPLTLDYRESLRSINRGGTQQQGLWLLSALPAGAF